MFSWFWKETFWLPANTTWEDISNGPGKAVVYAEAKDYWVQIPLVVVGLLLKFLSERYVFNPLGKFLKISDFKLKPPPNIELEAEYRKSSTCKDVTALAKQLDLSERKIKQWLRIRRAQDKPTTLQKFCENMWKGCHYTINVSLGLYVAWGQDWLRDVDKCLEGWPHEGLTPEFRWYFMIISTFYICLIATHFHDERRKDSWQIFFHHFVTLTLIFISWTCQLFRIGCLVQILHESSSIVVEFAKAAKCARFYTVLKVMFAVFVLVWVITRLVLFPAFILPKAFKYRVIAPLGSWIFILLVILLVLTFFWTLVICVVLRRLLERKVLTDVRSSESEEEDL